MKTVRVFLFTALFLFVAFIFSLLGTDSALADSGGASITVSCSAPEFSKCFDYIFYNVKEGLDGSITGTYIYDDLIAKDGYHITLSGMRNGDSVTLKIIDFYDPPRMPQDNPNLIYKITITYNLLGSYNGGNINGTITGSYVFERRLYNEYGAIVDSGIDTIPFTGIFTGGLSAEIEEVKQPDPPPDSQFGDKNPVGDPINSVTGNMHIITSDLNIPGKGLDFSFVRTYNSQANETGPLGYGWTHSYNIYLIQLETYFMKIKDEQARGYIFAYNGKDAYISQRGEYSQLTQTQTGSIWRKKDGTQYNFDPSNKLVQITDRNNNTVKLSYDSQKRLTQITDSANRVINLTYNAQNLLSRISGPMGRNVDYAYDGAGNLIRVTDPQGNITSYEYDANHNLTKKTDALGNKTYFTYDSQDRCTASKGENNSNYTSIAFDSVNKVNTISDSKGNQTRHYYNDDLLITKIIDSQANQTISNWDRNLNLISRADALGRNMLMEYDKQGNLIKVTNPAGNVNSFTYEPNFNLIKTSTDAQGNVAAYEYDAKSNLLKFTDVMGNTTVYTYDSSGQPLTVTNPLGKVTTFTYDAQGNLVGTKDASGNTVSFAYDDLGNLTQSKDAKNNITKFSYDSLNHLTQTVYVDNSMIGYAYDAVGNRISVSDQASNRTDYSYDQDQQIKSVTDALGHKVNNVYDTEGNLIFVVDQNNQKTIYEYDSLNRLVKETNALGYTTIYQYDAVGNRISSADAKGKTTQYQYDKLNCLTKIISPDPSETSFAYDVLGRRVSMKDASGITVYSYDNLGRLTKVDGPSANDTVGYTYDNASNRLTMTDPDGKITKYIYDALNRLISLTDPQGKVTTYSYDAVNNLINAKLPNSTSASYAYDNLNRLTKLTNQKGSSKLSEFIYAYDIRGLRISVTQPNAKINYTYDAPGQLTGENRTSTVNPYQINYSYDNAGNRLQMVKNNLIYNYTYNQLNQLIRERINSAPQTKKVTVTGTVSDKNGIKSVAVNGLNAVVSSTGFSCANVVLNPGQNTITVVASDKAGNSATKSISVVYQPAGAVSEEIIYTYDENGNLIKQQKGTEVINLTYDARNQLKAYVSPTQSLAYNYDGDGKRISAKAGTVTTSYFYDGMNVVLERQANKTTSSYVRNPFASGGIGGIISSTAASQLSYYLYDGLGSVANLTNSSGGVTQSYVYDGFGNLQGLSPKGTVPTFLTKELDQSGLVYFGSRYYYPRIGRFISPDPSGMSDGPNLYLYCLNDPINYIDLWGLCGDKKSSGFDLDDFLYRLEDWSTVLSMNPVADGMPMVPLDQGIGFIGLGVSKVGRVFWTGGGEAMSAAMKFAKRTGRVTLEMTKAGQRLLNAAEATGKTRWIYASKQFAKGAEGIVHVFIKSKVNPKSIWKKIEAPILKNSSKVIKIIEHIIE